MRQGVRQTRGMECRDQTGRKQTFCRSSSPVLSRGEPPDSTESRRPQQQPGQEPLDGKKRYTDTEKAPGEGRLKFLLHRIITVGRLSRGLTDRTDVASVFQQILFLIQFTFISIALFHISPFYMIKAHFERLKVRIQRSRPGEEVTGVLLLYPEHTLIVIECSTEALLCVLQDLRHMEEDLHSGLILTPRILLVTHDLHSRLFQQWNYTLVNESESDGRRTIDSEDQTLVSETLSRVLRLGRLLLNAAEHMKGSTVIPDEVLQDVSDVIPPQAAVCRLVQMEALLSPARYMNTYHSPLHQPLDSGNTHTHTHTRCLTMQTCFREFSSHNSVGLDLGEESMWQIYNIELRHRSEDLYTRTDPFPLLTHTGGIHTES
ncbi:unnamed protein product [Leuciscus chuanchicus]